MAGRVTVITGPMRSGKTLRVIMEAVKAESFGKIVSSFHPSISSRWGEHELVSRLKLRENGVYRKLSFPSSPVPTSLELFSSLLPPGVNLVIFDDAQFFSEHIVSVAKELRDKDIDVLISGLDMDCFMQPFGPMPLLMAVADEVIKTTARCEYCSSHAQTTYRVTGGSEQVVVGDKDYISLCYDCWRDSKKGDVYGEFEINKEG